MMRKKSKENRKKESNNHLYSTESPNKDGYLSNHNRWSFNIDGHLLSN